MTDSPSPERSAASAPSVVAAPTDASAPISYDTFSSIDLRVGLVVAAEPVPKAKKLLKLTVDLGEATPRTIVAGLALSYAPETLQGKRVAVVANLAPAKLMGVESQGMVLAAGDGPDDLRVIEPAADLPPGTRIK